MRHCVDIAEEIAGAVRRFSAACDSASPDLWLFRDARGDSMANIAEHVWISNRRIAGLLARRLPLAPIRPGETDVVDAEIPFLFDRASDGPPEGTEAGGGWQCWRDNRPAFETAAADLIAFANDPGIDLRSHGIRHPFFGMLDGVQWLLFAVAHAERHRVDLLNLKRRFGAATAAA